MTLDSLPQELHSILSTFEFLIYKLVAYSHLQFFLRGTCNNICCLIAYIFYYIITHISCSSIVDIFISWLLLPSASSGALYASFFPFLSTSRWFSRPRVSWKTNIFISEEFLNWPTLTFNLFSSASLFSCVLQNTTLVCHFTVYAGHWEGLGWQISQRYVAAGWCCVGLNSPLNHQMSLWPAATSKCLYCYQLS